MIEHIRTWYVQGEWRLDLWATDRTDYRGQTVLRYALFDYQYRGGKLVFEGDDFCGSPMHADDSDDTVAALLSFLSLRAGDTDAEYFENYTVDQLEWRDDRAEDLSMCAMELKDSERVGRE